MAQSFTHFGLELEGQIPENLGLDGFLKELSKITNISSGFSTTEDPYGCWMIGPERDIETDLRYCSAEIISPILKSNEDVEEVRAVWGKCAELGFLPLPKSCGVHIHFSWPHPVPIELLSFRLLVGYLADELFKKLKIAEERQGWTGSASDLKNFLQETKQSYNQMNAEFVSTNQISDETKEGWKKLLIKSANPFDPDLNNKQSFMRVTSFGTLEIRGMNSTLDLDEVLRVKNLFLQLIYIASHDVGFVFELINREEKLSLDSILQLAFSLD